MSFFGRKPKPKPGPPISTRQRPLEADYSDRQGDRDSELAAATNALSVREGNERVEQSHHDNNDQDDGTASDSDRSSGEVERFGLQTLRPLQSRDGSGVSQTKIDIVAVHGLGGHMYDTWTDKSRGKLWLRDFLHNDIADAHIMTFGYNSAVAFSGSEARIEDFAIDLLNQLKLKRRQAKTQDNPVIFICHSLGGIVVKKAMILAHSRNALFGQLLPHIKGIMFMGTPHRGSDVASWTRVLRTVASAALRSSVRKDLLSDLERNSPTLEDIGTQFVERAVDLQIVTVYERQVVKGLNRLVSRMHPLFELPANRSDQVVEKASAVLNLPNEELVPVEADHIGMCKYRSSSSSKYQVVADCIVRLAEKAHEQLEQVYKGPQSLIVPSLRRESKYDRMRQALAIRQICKGTCVWIMEDSSYIAWKELSSCRLLWIHGPPGTGKTILATYILGLLSTEHFRPSARHSDSVKSRKDPPRTIVAQYFFRRSGARGNDGQDTDGDVSRYSRASHYESGTIHFLKEVVAQLLEADARLIAHIPKDYWHQTSDFYAGPDENDCLESLKCIVQPEHGPLISIVLDALDEAGGVCGAEILSILNALIIEDRGGRLKIVVTDRQQLRRPLSSLPSDNVREIEVRGPEVASDVVWYITEQIRIFAERERVSEDIEDQIREAVIDAASGTFLQAKLAIKHFTGHNTRYWTPGLVRQRLSAISSVTPNLESFYCGLLQQIPEDFAPHAKTVFAMVSASMIDVSVEQLRYAVALSDEHSSFAEVRDDLPYSLEVNIVEFCGHLLTVESGVVRFYHHSALELFDGEGVQSPENFELLQTYRYSKKDRQDFMTQLYIRILRLAEVRSLVMNAEFDPLMVSNESGYSGCEDQLVQLALPYPLLLEAMAFWDVHFARGSQSPETVEVVGTWLFAQFAGRLYRIRSRSRYPYRWIHLPAKLLEHGSLGQIDHFFEYGSARFTSKSGLSDSQISPIFLTILYGDSPDLLAWVREKGARVNEICCKESPLTTAIAAQRFSIISVLLNDPNISIVLPTGFTQPLHYAMQGGFFDRVEGQHVIERLLGDSRVDINAKDPDGKTALYWYIQFRNPAASSVWKTLMARPDLDIHAATEKGITPFIASFSERGGERLALDMLHRGDTLAEQIAKQEAVMFGEPLMVRAEVFGWSEVEAELLRLYPKYPALNLLQNGFCLLTWYAYLGNKRQVLKLLDAMPPSLLKPLLLDSQWDLVSLCAHQDWNDVVTLLREKFGLSSSKPDHRHRNLLHWVVENGWVMGSHYAVDELDLQDLDGKTPLHIAAELANSDAAQWLLNAGARYLLPDKYGRNAVHVAAEFFCRRILSIFLDRPLREFRRDKHGRSLLHYLSKWSEGEFIHAFCKKKRFIIDVRDRDRRTPLHYAALCSNTGGAEALLDWGADPNARDKNGCTPLHYAARDGNLQLFRALVDFGANVALLNGLEQNCQQLAMISGSRALVQTLLHEPGQAAHTALSGRTTFHIACQYAADSDDDHWGFLAQLLELGTYTNNSDNHGWTVLHVASWKGCQWLVTRLLDLTGAHAVHRSLRDAYGCSPLDLADITYHRTVATSLMNAGGISTVKPEGRSAMRRFFTPPASLSARYEETPEHLSLQVHVDFSYPRMAEHFKNLHDPPPDRDTIDNEDEDKLP